mmetsp:Transcript_27503/g.57108  ORF Transcript_27503/g.57108 Transcript_27503/m.57108 type:complete len:86 (+) Transcript_27503:1527-1784(+)
MYCSAFRGNSVQVEVSGWVETTEQVAANPVAVAVNAGGQHATGTRCGGADGGGMGTRRATPSLPSRLILVAPIIALYAFIGLSEP